MKMTRCSYRLLACTAWVQLALIISPTFASDAAKPLNIVFILADDLGWGELGCYGQQKIPTPNLDRLASQGMRFTQHYSGAPTCAPSRCVLMTGKHLGHAEIRGNQQANKTFPQYKEGQHPISDAALTFAQVFQQAGYATGAFGKWGLGPVGSTGDPNRKGFDLFFGYNCQAVAHSYYPATLWKNDQQVPLNANPISGHEKPVKGDVKLEDYTGENYAPHKMIAEAEAFIVANRQKPFLLYVPLIEPHVAMHPPREDVEKFPTDWDDEPYRGEAGYLPHPRPRAGYAAMIANIDAQVGRILAALDQHGLADHTLVVFTSDNGTTLAGPPNSKFNIGGVDAKFFNSTGGLRGFKGSVYEGGLRVPMIARLPGKIPHGTVNHTPCYFADWFPTLCAAAGLPCPQNLDGVNLWPTMTGGTELANRPPMIWVFAEYGGQVAVRLGNLKAVRRNLKTKKPGAWEVYNLSEDPAETRDLAASSQDFISQVEKTLSREVAPNATFPLKIPGVN